MVAIVLRLPAFFATRSLVFDDGVYASSALAMRNGLQPFRDVFSSQGPVFLPLVWLADLLGFRTLDAPRLLTVASGVLLTIAVYSCARRVTTRGHALLAAGLVTTSGSVLWVTAPVNADGPSLALSVLAIALALRALDHATPHLTDAVWVGLAAGAAASIKALSVPADRDRRSSCCCSHAGACGTRRWRRRSRSACTSSPRCPGGWSGCSTSRSRTTTRRGA